MKTVEDIVQFKSRALDGRDVSRLASFIPVADWPKVGIELRAGVDPASVEILALTRENVLTYLARDLDFAFEKALDKRGISAGIMHSVIKMWVWVLEDEPALNLYAGCDVLSDGMYPQYGLPALAAVARFYELPCPIGAERGDEYKYSAESDY